MKTTFNSSLIKFVYYATIIMVNKDFQCVSSCLLAEERFVEFEAETADDSVVRFTQREVIVVDCRSACYQ